MTYVKKSWPFAIISSQSGKILWDMFTAQCPCKVKVAGFERDKSLKQYHTDYVPDKKPFFSE